MLTAATSGRIDSAGPGDAPLATNGGLAVDGQGNVFNIDYDSGLLRSWASDGTYRWSLGDRGDGPARLDASW